MYTPSHCRGGWQYISRGLLTKLNSECEVAAVLARGTAHTALRSATRELTHASLMKLATVPLIFVGQAGASNTFDSDIAVPLTILKFRRDDELDADYFGIPYLYKSG
jgi:predicted Zn-dependent protease